MTAPEPTDQEARLALVRLHGLGPARLHWLLSAGTPAEIVVHLRAGRLPPTLGEAPAGVNRSLVNRWIDDIRRCDVDQLWDDNTAHGGVMLDPSHRLWPFVDDPEPPAVLFARGDTSLLTAPAMVAVVGTRRCSAVGRHVATELGAELAEAGVVVVSGLATGIDGCAHRGVLAAGGRPVAVVGTGLDVVYPAANRKLWFRAAEAGLLLSEAPAGATPERWRFPARNRLIAALADAVVVVESHTTGGSMHTVHEAAERGRLVMAVPGAVTNPAAAGTNELLAEGCPPVTRASDVIEILGLPRSTPDVGSPSAPGEGSPLGSDRPTGASDGPPLVRAQPHSASEVTPIQERILAEVRAGSVHLDELVGSTVGPGSPAASIRTVLANVQVLVGRGQVELDGSTVSLRQQPPL